MKTNPMDLETILTPAMVLHLLSDSEVIPVIEFSCYDAEHGEENLEAVSLSSESLKQWAKNAKRMPDGGNWEFDPKNKLLYVRL